MKRTPAQRIELYRAQAAQIEERERRKLLGRSPQWLATKRAIANLELALNCSPDEMDPIRDGIVPALETLEMLRDKHLGTPEA